MLLVLLMEERFSVVIALSSYPVSKKKTLVFISITSGYIYTALQTWTRSQLLKGQPTPNWHKAIKIFVLSYVPFLLRIM